MIAKATRFVKCVVPAVMKPMQIVWNQVIGFFFVVLALWAVPSAVRHIQTFDGDADSFFRIALTSIFILVMGGFGISSFLRARKISKT